MEWLFGYTSSGHMMGKFWFVHTEDYRLWAKDKPALFNSYAYIDMVNERTHATRLEF